MSDTTMKMAQNSPVRGVDFLNDFLPSRPLHFLCSANGERKIEVESPSYKKKHGKPSERC